MSTWKSLSHVPSLGLLSFLINSDVLVFVSSFILFHYYFIGTCWFFLMRGRKGINSDKMGEERNLEK